MFDVYLWMFLIEVLWRNDKKVSLKIDEWDDVNCFVGEFIVLVDKYFCKVYFIVDYVEMFYVFFKLIVKCFNVMGYKIFMEIICDWIVLEVKCDLCFI